MTKEVWLPIPDYELKYWVSNMGNVKNKDKILKPRYDKDGYVRAALFKSGKYKYFFIHRLVAKVFISGYFEGAVVNHKNEIKHDNRSENLEWVSVLDNNLYREHHVNVGKKKSIPVVQMSLTGDIIQQFNSIKEATKKTGVDTSQISKVIRGKLKTAGGYIWKSKKEQ